MNASELRIFARNHKLGWHQCRRSVLIGVLVGAIPFASFLVWITTELERSDAMSAIIGVPGDVHYSDKSTWDSWHQRDSSRQVSWPPMSGRDGRWDARSSKFRWGFDSPVLADGFEVAIVRHCSDAALANQHLQSLRPLRTLSLQYSPVTDAGLVSLRSLTQLAALDLDSTRVTGVGLEHLRGMTRLRWLSLRGTEVSDEGIENLAFLSRLQWLDLSATAISDAGLTHLEGLRQLEVLGVSNTKVTDAGAEKLQQALPMCQIVR